MPVDTLMFIGCEEHLFQSQLKQQPLLGASGLSCSPQQAEFGLKSEPGTANSTGWQNLVGFFAWGFAVEQAFYTSCAMEDFTLLCPFLCVGQKISWPFTKVSAAAMLKSP